MATGSAAERPSWRRHLADGLLVTGALAFGLAVQQDVLFGDVAHLGTIGVLDLTAGALCLSSIVWLRRRAPVAFTLLAVAASLVTTIAGAVPLLGAYTVAAHRRRSVASAVAAVVVLNAAVLQLLVFPVPDGPWIAAGGALLTAAATGWGMYAQARRHVVELLAREVDEARRAAADRQEATRRDERRQIAREMHDALGHRLSLIAVHSGALAFRRDRTDADVEDIAGVLRDQARLALDELRAVVTVLRDGDEPAAGPPPGPQALRRLVDEARQAGLQVTLVLDAEGLPDGLARTTHRLLQEALTNSRRHGSGLEVRAEVRGAPGGELRIVVEEPGTRPVTPPGPESGLAGLRERVILAGGRFAAGPAPGGGFRVHAVLPWPSRAHVAADAT